MVLDEQELRQRLKATAERIGAPHFTVARLAGRIRRHRAKIIGLASGSLLAVAGIAVAVPVALSSPRPGPILGAPLQIASRVSFTVAVNSQHPARLKNAPPPVFTFTPGKHLSISVGLIVHAHAKVTNLWLGIAKAGIGTPGPDGQRPPGMQPVLAHAPGPLTPGAHTFRLAWTMPAHLPRGASISLVAGWQQPEAEFGASIADLVLPPGSVMSAAQACRQVVGTPIQGASFSGVERVRLVLTRYAANQPLESTHDVGTAIPPRTLVWVIEVHAKAIHWRLPISLPNHQASARPDTDFSVVMNARTAVMSDFSESNHWPLPLSQLGTVVSLPPQC
jgi:hypothetical protein